MSLDRYGVESPDVVRAPVEDRHNSDLKACPECGQPVGDATTLKISSPDIVDDVHVSRLITRAYRCARHADDVVLPVHVGRGAPGFGRSWTTVRVRFSDQRVRRVAVPKKVLTE